ncbi:AraC family transcriptional regulator [Rhizobacter sp. Root1221]|nr:AraC family transcriptional regulator [Rhizobacter sp. Root1221]
MLARQHRQGVVLPQHQHRTAQLVFALSGVMSVETDRGRWTVPPQRALWLPPDHPHTILMLSDTAMRTVYFDPSFVAGCAGFERRGEVHATVASPLVRELVLGLFEVGRTVPMQGLMAALLLHALRESACLPTQLPWPTTEPLRLAAKRVIDQGLWSRPMADLAATIALSERTFTRRFTAETGMNFRTWRQRARLIASLDLLASNHSIKAVAHRMKFDSAAAYATAFSVLFGCPPHAFRQLDGVHAAA